jgi:hypothetical protein
MKTYIGDSVYATLKDDAIVLTTENGLPTDPSNVIVLEHHVLQQLLRFAAEKGLTKPEQPEQPEAPKQAAVETPAGEVRIVTCGDGVELFAPGNKEPIAYVDLFYLLEGRNEYSTSDPNPALRRLGLKSGCVQLVIGDQRTEDPVAFAVYRPEGTRVEFEHGVVEQDGFHGYPEDPSIITST